MIPNSNMMPDTDGSNDNRNNKIKVLFVYLFFVLFLIIFFVFLFNFGNNNYTNKKDINPEIAEQMKKTSRGDFIVLKDESILLVSSPGKWSSDGYFLAKGRLMYSPKRYDIKDFHYEVDHVVFKDDTVKWNNLARNFLINR